jgi:hypothetical protein
MMCWLDQCSNHVGCLFKHFWTFCTIFWHTALPLNHHYMPLSAGSDFQWEKHFSPIKTDSHYKLLCRTMFPVSLPLHVNFKLNLLSVWLTDWLIPFVACYTYQVLPPTKKHSAWVTQKLQAREPYLLNMPYIRCLLNTFTGNKSLEQSQILDLSCQNSLFSMIIRWRWLLSDSMQAYLNTVSQSLRRQA